MKLPGTDDELRQERIQRILSDFSSREAVSNSRFDYLFPEDVRKNSSRHWTPLDVCQEVVSLLDLKPKMKILDIGSGCGKFCLVGALSYPEIQFTGIEQRPHLVSIAQSIASELQIKNIHFIEGNMMDINWHEFQGFYLFNPFYENTLLPNDRIDLTIPASQLLFELYLDTVSERLKSLPIGTRVVTYHTFGGSFPDEYDLEIKKPCGTSHLELWIRNR